MFEIDLSKLANYDVSQTEKQELLLQLYPFVTKKAYNKLIEKYLEPESIVLLVKKIRLKGEDIFEIFTDEVLKKVIDVDVNNYTAFVIIIYFMKKNIDMSFYIKKMKHVFIADFISFALAEFGEEQLFVPEFLNLFVDNVTFIIPRVSDKLAKKVIDFYLYESNTVKIDTLRYCLVAVSDDYPINTKKLEERLLQCEDEKINIWHLCKILENITIEGAKKFIDKRAKDFIIEFKQPYINIPKNLKYYLADKIWSYHPKEATLFLYKYADSKTFDEFLKQHPEAEKYIR